MPAGGPLLLAAALAAAPSVGPGPADGVVAAVVPAGPVCAPGTRIAKIDVEVLDVFDLTAPEQSRWFHRAANAVHAPMRSRAWAIRKVLTLREGDRCTPEALLEAERGLRLFTFVQDAWVEAVARSGDDVTVRVRVRDAWSTRVRLSFDAQGGEDRSKFKLYEQNLLGTGTALGWENLRGPERTERALDVSAPALLGRGWRAASRLSDNSDGYHREASLERPFRSLADDWSLSIAGTTDERDEKVYGGPDPIDVWRLDGHSAAILAGFSPGGSEDVVVRRFAGLAFERRSWRLADAPGVGPLRPDLAPRDAATTALRFGVERREIDFRRVRRVETDTRIEDFDLGAVYSAWLDVAPKALSPDAALWLRLAARKGFELRDGSFFVIEATHEIRRLRGDWYGARTGLDARWWRVLSPSRTAFFRAFALTTRGADGPDRPLLGGDTGLRGYEAHAFAGANLLLAVAEHRWFTSREILGLARIGFAAFVDAGGAFDGAPSWRDLHPDVGVGLRLAVLRTAHGTTLHFDAAYALDPNGPPNDGRRLRLSFTTVGFF